MAGKEQAVAALVRAQKGNAAVLMEKMISPVAVDLVVLIKNVPENKTMPLVMLRKMKKNQKGIIRAVKKGGELGRRIRDMGIVPGSEIMVQGRAPLYDPVALRVMGSVLTLRNNEADFIEVEVDAEA